jgi:uncharacterized protein (DUF433 family)
MIHPQYTSRIIQDPKRCGGAPTIRGTRVTVRAILASLAEGDRSEEIVQAFPSLCLHDVRAVIAFAAASACDNLPQQIMVLNAS